MITEEKQRKVYEWRYPELKERPRWTRYLSEFDEEYPEDPLVCTITVCCPMDECPIRWGVEPLYLRDGTPNYQFFITECVPNLKTEKVEAMFQGKWYLRPTLRPQRFTHTWADTDPYAALVEMLEAR